jgi:hypothetical protein
MKFFNTQYEKYILNGFRPLKNSNGTPFDFSTGNFTDNLKRALRGGAVSNLRWYNYLMAFVIVLYTLGIINSTPKSLLELNSFIKIIIAAYLIYRFNDFNDKKTVFTEFDRELVFTTSVYIIFLSFADLIFTYLTDVRNIVKEHSKELLQ